MLSLLSLPEKPIRSQARKPSVGLDDIVQPAPNEIARVSTAGKNFVMATTATKVSRPAAFARLLRMHVSGSQPIGLTFEVDTGVQVAHRAVRVADESMTSRQIAVGRNPEVSGTGTARIWAVCAAL